MTEINYGILFGRNLTKDNTRKQNACNEHFVKTISDRHPRTGAEPIRKREDGMEQTGVCGGRRYSRWASRSVRKAAERAGAVCQKSLYCAKWATASAVAPGVSLTIRQQRKGTP